MSRAAVWCFAVAACFATIAAEAWATAAYLTVTGTDSVTWLLLIPYAVIGGAVGGAVVRWTP